MLGGGLCAGIYQWLTRRRVATIVALALILTLLPDPQKSSAHSAPANPVFQSLASNNGVTYGNPSFTVANSTLDFDITWTPCNRNWSEPVGVRIVGLDSAGNENTAWSGNLGTFNYGQSNNNCPYTQPVHKSFTITDSAIAKASFHEVQFRGTTTNTIFTKARSTTKNVPEPAYGPACFDKGIVHGTTTTSECDIKGHNGRVGYGNPNFKVNNSGTGTVDFDVTWSVCDNSWLEPVTVWMRGVTSSGDPVSGAEWAGGSSMAFFNYGASGCQVYAQPVHKHTAAIPNSTIANAPGHELEFRGANSGTVFIRAKDWGVGQSPEQAAGTDCLGDSAPHASNPTRCDGDPVNTATGAFVNRVTDATLGGSGLGFSFERSYNSSDLSPGVLGLGWTHSYEASLAIKADGDAIFTAEDGQQVRFEKKADGSFKPFAGGRSKLTSVTGGYELVRSNQTRYSFDSTGKLTALKDRNNVGVTLSYTSGLPTTVTDSVGRSVTLGYTSGKLTSVSLPGGRSVSYGYTSGRLTSVTDVRGGTTDYLYDDNDRLTDIIDQNDNSVVVNVYGRNGRVTRQRDARGNWTDFGWDAATGTATMTDARGHVWKDIYSYNVLKETIDPYGNSTKFTYDSDLNVTKVEDPNGNATTMTYDAAGNMLTRTAPAPLSYSESWTYNSRNDVTSHTNRRGKLTTFEYSTAGNLTKITRPGQVVTTLTRDPSTGLVTAVKDPELNETTFGYDTDRNLNSITKPSGDKTTFGYDSSGRMTSMVEPRGNVAGADPMQYTWSYGYDAANHLTTVTDPLNHVTEWRYDPAGNLDWVKDAKLRKTDYTYYPDNRLHKVIAPDLTETVYGYDSVGNLTTRTDANLHATTYGYDDADRLVSSVLPNGQTWTYTYDAAGNVKTIVDAEGNFTTGDATDGKTTFGFDELNRLKSIDYSDSTPDVAFTYDENSNLKTMADGSGTETWGYDDLDRVTSIARGTDVFSYEYDAASNIKKRTYPDSTVIDYTYTDDGYMDTVTSGGGVTDYDYFAGGLLEKTTLPSTNGYWENRTYDRAGRLTEIENTNGTDVLSRFTYVLDEVGSPETVTDEDNNVTSFGYDPDSDFLTEVCYQASCPGANDPFIRYEYDAVGNRTKEIRPSGTTTYTHDASDRLDTATDSSGTTTFTHDRNGNLTGDGSSSYAYDLAGRMKSIVQGSTTTTYSYDGLGRRLQASTGPNSADKTNFIWDPMGALPELAIEENGNGARLRRYVHGLGPISMNSGSSTSYYHRDMLGSITNVTDESGVTQWSYAYEPFGTTTATQLDSQAAANPLAFTGQYQDPTGMYHLRARQYDSGLGRFSARDPLGQIGRGYSAPYGYAANRPGALTDPSGLYPLEPNRPPEATWQSGFYSITGTVDTYGAGAASASMHSGASVWTCADGVTCVVNPEYVLGDAAATTYGHFIFFTRDPGKCLLEHELTHVAQYERDDDFLGNYVNESGSILMENYQPETAYDMNPYEIEASGAEYLCKHPNAVLGNSSK